MNQAITRLNLVRSEIGDDGLKAWRWWNTGMWGASMGSNPRSFFSGSMWRPFADTENLDSSYLWDIQASQVTSSLEFTSVFQRMWNAFWKIILVSVLPRVIHQSSAWHSAYISSTFAGLGFWAVFSRIMTLFLKMEAVIILGKSILVGRSCRLDKIVLFDFFENQKIRCPLFGERFENFDI